MCMSNKKRYLFFISQDYSFPVLRPLQKAILARGNEVKWFMYGDEITKSYLQNEEYSLESIDEVINFNPHAVFVPGNVVPSFIPGLKIEVFHGLPSTKAKKNGQLYHYIIGVCLTCTVHKVRVRQVNLKSFLKNIVIFL